MTAPQTPSRVDEPGHRPQDPSSGSQADGSAPGLATTGAPADRARKAGERAGDLLRSLMSEVDRLRARLKEYDRMQVLPAPEIKDDPGYEVWRALMEDLRDEGVVRMTVHHETAVVIGYEPRQEALSDVADPLHKSGPAA